MLIDVKSHILVSCNKNTSNLKPVNTRQSEYIIVKVHGLVVHQIEDFEDIELIMIGYEENAVGN